MTKIVEVIPPLLDIFHRQYQILAKYICPSYLEKGVYHTLKDLILTERQYIV